MTPHQRMHPDYALGFEAFKVGNTLPHYYGLDHMTTEKKPRIRRSRAEIQASQIDDLVAGLRALNPDDIVELGQKLQAQAPRTTAALWDALSDREKDLGKEPPVDHYYATRTVGGANFVIKP